MRGVNKVILIGNLGKDPEVITFDTAKKATFPLATTEFFKNKQQQEIVKKSGVRLSVGFDGHIANEYKVQRVQTACKLIKDMGIRLVFENK